ncbi:helix-turn-helix domain-containing protein [Methylobacterium sp. J-059]|uniref:helix-turn-helix domain-containing protein n=1 Tax=Methylobacterium sp. J-059 TaxID=2836643 RepID=UPI001FBA3AC3|nr:helix-turn-helix domain-containing protein [Methylobacterium sp. J-059]MCJ2037479.1 helix-turn-helix domain-containing protein [Methylobacterium sp. J-059]
MDYAYEIRRQAEAAPRAALPAVASALWKAFGEGHLSEAEAEALSGLIEARQADVGTHAPKLTGSPRTGVGSRPRTDASMARRRRWAASGRLPPGLAARFTLAEQAVLALVAAETVRRKDCRLAVEHLAATVGVCRSTVKNAVREARKLGLLTVEERPVTGFRNLPNVVRIVSAEWTAWLRLARKGGTDRYPPGEKGVADQHPHAERAKLNLGCQGTRGAAPRQPGGGVKSPTRTATSSSYPVNSGTRNTQKGCRQAAGDASGKARSEIHAVGMTVRAMR